MYRKPFIFAAIGALIGWAAFGAVTYEFRQISHSDFESTADGEVTGTGFIDGNRSRVELIKGAGQTPGTYIITHNDTQMVFIVDPVHKRFSEISVAKIASALGSSQIQINNFKSNMTRMDDHPIVAGLPTDHYRVHASYDITVMFGNLPLRQSVTTSIDKWVTTAFGELMDPAMSRAVVRTGNESVDQLIETEMTKVKGFPLRQVTTIQTTVLRTTENTRSKLKLSPTRRQTSELLITRIQTAQSNPVVFEVPKSYAKVDPAAYAEGPVVQMLSMQP